MILALLFSLSLVVHAEEPTGMALGQTTGELLVDSSVAFFGPELSSTLAAGTAAILTIATAYAQWTEPETRRRYRDAAVEGRERLARGEATPISNADPESSLRLVAELERAANPSVLQYPEFVSEGNVVRLIVARAQQLNP